MPLARNWSAGICVEDPRSQKRDPPNFLYVVLDRTACAPFYTERRIECEEPTKLRRKSGTWGTHHLIQEVLHRLLSPLLFSRSCSRGAFIPASIFTKAPVALNIVPERSTPHLYKPEPGS